jgi:LPPG:FO 2-phospho-L-lactate transferase
VTRGCISREGFLDSCPVLALAGGVGGAKLAHGLSNRLEEALTMLVNTGDDFEHLGWHVSPDLDTVTYTLAGIANSTQGWGLENETWSFMDQLARIGGPAWFKLGDRDLATHAYRTLRLREGATLSQVTAELCAAFGIRSRILPMSDDPIRTVVYSGSKRYGFQEYFVRLACSEPVSRISYDGIDEAHITPLIGDLEQTEAIIICPSNPYLSIDPILAVPGFRQKLNRFQKPIVAVSPIVGGAAIKGPAAKIMGELNIPATALSIARHYAGLIQGLVIDIEDASLAASIEREGVVVHVTQTVMKSHADRIFLADECLKFVRKLRTENPSRPPK